MTLFGPDVSSFQNGLDLAQLRSASFVIAKTTEGTYYTDADYQGWRQQAGRLGLPFVWYHFLSGEDAHAQVAHTKANIGDAILPGMLDVEPEGSFSPTLAQVIAYADAAHANGLNLKLIYLPRWFWQQMGSPNLSPLAARGLSLVASSYPGGTGTPQALYPGDKASGWQGYGGMTPLLYQYTNQATDGGKPLDYNAFRGTVQQLLDALGPTTTTGVVDVTPEEHNWLTNLYSGEFFGGPSCGRPGADGKNSTVSKLDYLMNAVDALAARPVAPVPVVDVNALAAALAPLLATGPTADQVAVAVQQHLAAQLVKP